MKMQKQGKNMLQQQEDNYPHDEVEELTTSLIKFIGDGRNTIVVLNALTNLICAVIDSSIDDDEMKESAAATVVSSVMMSLMGDDLLEVDPESLN